MKQRIELLSELISLRQTQINTRNVLTPGETKRLAEILKNNADYGNKTIAELVEINDNNRRLAEVKSKAPADVELQEIPRIKPPVPSPSPLSPPSPTLAPVPLSPLLDADDQKRSAPIPSSSLSSSASTTTAVHTSSSAPLSSTITAPIRPLHSSLSGSADTKDVNRTAPILPVSAPVIDQGKKAEVERMIELKKQLEREKKELDAGSQLTSDYITKKSDYATKEKQLDDWLNARDVHNNNYNGLTSEEMEIQLKDDPPIVEAGVRATNPPTPQHSSSTLAPVPLSPVFTPSTPPREFDAKQQEFKTTPRTIANPSPPTRPLTPSLSERRTEVEHMIAIQKGQQEAIAKGSLEDYGKKLELATWLNLQNNKNYNMPERDYKKMEKELEKELFQMTSSAVTIPVISKEIQDIVAAYNNQFKRVSGYLSGYQPPKIEEGKAEFSFPTPGDAANFLKTQAEQCKKFAIFDPLTNRVMAYSNGDGTLYNANTGKEFKTTGPDKETLLPSNIPAEGYTIPPKAEPASTSSMSPT